LVKKEGDRQDKDLILGSLDRRRRNGPARLGIGSDLEGEHGIKKVPAWFGKEIRTVKGPACSVKARGEAEDG
jgi:hypothetical protein